MADIAIEERVEIYGREYQRYSVANSAYLIPIDSEEEQRLEEQNNILRVVFQDEVFHPDAHIGDLDPERILDLGCGTCQWAAHAAGEFGCQVTAVDIWHEFGLETLQEEDDVDLVFHNLNTRLTSSLPRDHFDLVHSRFVSSGLNRSRWKEYIKDIRRVLKRGGKACFAEYYCNFQSKSGLADDNTEIRKWWNAMQAAMQQCNKEPRAAGQLENWMIEAGFSHVRKKIVDVPIGQWDPDPTQNAIGGNMLPIAHEMLESHALLPMSQMEGWSADAARVQINLARGDLQNLALKLYLPLYCVWGQK